MKECEMLKDFLKDGRQPRPWNSTQPCVDSLFDLILYVLSTIFQLYKDGPSWVEPVLS